MVQPNICTICASPQHANLKLSSMPWLRHCCRVHKGGSSRTPQMLKSTAASGVQTRWPQGHRPHSSSHCDGQITGRLQHQHSTSIDSFWLSESDKASVAEQEAAFSANYGHLGYGYSNSLQALRSEHFPQLSGGIVYLDHAAATLYSAEQLLAANAELSKHLFANPHTQLGAELDSTATAIEQLRQMTLSMLNASADEYEVIITSGATAALKLAGECFPWTPGYSTCAYTTINHNSALGIRQLAAAAGAQTQAVDLQQLLRHAQQQHRQHQQQRQQEDQDPYYSMLLVPAECNFSGSRYDTEAIFTSWQQQQQQRHDPKSAESQQQQQQQQQQRERWLLVVDAAKACGSHPPDCSDGVIDMLALSYYKIFGHPTGLGALVVRRSLLPLLLPQKTYFGGGTVEVVLPEGSHVVRRKGAAGFEDGTLPFTSIAAARHGFAQLAAFTQPAAAAPGQTLVKPGQLSSLTMFDQLLTGIDRQRQLLRASFDRVDRHMAGLTWSTMQQLLLLRHSNGQRVAELYCQPEAQDLLLLGHTAASNGSSSRGNLRAADQPPDPAAAAAVPSADVLRQFQAVQGPVVIFNLLRPDGSFIGHQEVSKLASIHGIALRTGCLCNPGACCHYLNMTSNDMLHNHAAGHVCWDDHDIIDGRPTGAVRVSFGYMSCYSDVAVFMKFLSKFFVTTAGSTAAAAAVPAAAPAAAAAHVGAQSKVRPAIQIAATAATTSTIAAAAAAAAGNGKHQQHQQQQATNKNVGMYHDIGSPTAAATPAAAAAAAGRLSALYLYPIKSCAPQQVTSWPAGPSGLLYDREWALVTPDGQVLTQKKCPKMTQLKPVVDLRSEVLRVSGPGMRDQLVVPLQQQQQQQQQQGRVLQEGIRICGDTVCSEVTAGHLIAAVINSPVSAAAAAAAAAVEQPDQAAAAAAAQQWFTEALGVPCKLVQQVSNSRSFKEQHKAQQQQQYSAASSSSSSSSSAGRPPSLGFANEGQYLLVNQASVDYVAGQLMTNQLTMGNGSSSSSSSSGGLDALRFRPNLVVEGLGAWEEDSWQSIIISSSSSSDASSNGSGVESNHMITSDPSSGSSSSSSSSSNSSSSSGDVALSVVGACGRCDMIRIDQQTGQRHGGQLLSLLAKERRQGGKLKFGILLADVQQQQQQQQEEDGIRWMSVGDQVVGVLAAAAAAK